MRNAFAEAVTDLARKRSDICLLSGDIGNRMFDRFKEVAPERFINCGIAEANMLSVAAGMAMNGLRPIVYTITPFVTTRCLEQIRIGVGYHEAPVVIVGTGSGLSYSELGPTHHSLEDMSIIRSVPNINVLAPCDSLELKGQLIEALNSPTPTYMRIGKKGEPSLGNGELRDSFIGKAHTLRNGEDVLLLTAGPISYEGLKAARILEDAGISTCVVSMGGCRPLDHDYLMSRISQFCLWVTLEEHSSSGGLGSSLLEWLNLNMINSIPLLRIGSNGEFIHALGSQAYTRERMGINALGIAASIKGKMGIIRA